MLNVKALLTKIVDIYDTPFKTATCTVSFGTISANSSKSGSTTATSVSGYKPVGITGWANVGNAAFHLYELHIGSNDDVVANARNNTSSQLTGCSVNVYVLYRKLGGVIRQLLSTFATLFNREGVAVC